MKTRKRTNLASSLKFIMLSYDIFNSSVLVFTKLRLVLVASTAQRIALRKNVPWFSYYFVLSLSLLVVDLQCVSRIPLLEVCTQWVLCPLFAQGLDADVDNEGDIGRRKQQQAYSELFMEENGFNHTNAKPVLTR